MSPATVAQSVLDAAGPQAAAIAWLWWVIFAITTGVFIAVVVVLAVAVRRRSDRASSEVMMTRWVVAASVGTVAILGVWLFASVSVGRATAAPRTADAVTINVTGRQWWWQLEYSDTLPSNRFRTANEVLIPVGRPVVLNVTSRDVIHSFWVPNLHGKRDLIPGYVTSLWFQADREGVYRGQCAEFCGYQHANMGLYVRAVPESDYQAWLTAQRKPASDPGTEQQQHGRDIFLRATCPQCHTIRGTLAGGAFGPDLTHVGSRQRIAAGVLPNTTENLQRWIRDPHQFKPGNKMPAHDLNDNDLRAVAEFLRSLE
ncbi:MAG TPA: cytochrome c oxidase subunit II [Vicinamibacterales bacterium]|nr:cytochrome c oxidase subunit II [Vicinamibacterales bacterium]